MPWFFTDFNGAIVLGFPLWAIYSLSMTVLYAVTIAVILGRYWNDLADEDDSEENSL